MDATKEIDSYFPEALRERVLNFVQFRNTPRMDDLGSYLPNHESSYFTNKNILIVNVVFEVYILNYIFWFALLIFCSVSKKIISWVTA